MDLYISRLKQLNSRYGDYKETRAAIDFSRSLRDLKFDNLLELRYTDKKRIHNLKYFTWIEQQGKSLEELNRQWYDEDNYWSNITIYAQKLDNLINEFNNKVGILEK